MTLTSTGLLAGLLWMKSRCPSYSRSLGRGEGGGSSCYKWLVHYTTEKQSVSFNHIQACL